MDAPAYAVNVTDPGDPQPPRRPTRETARGNEQRIATVHGIPIFVSATWYLVAALVTILFQPVVDSWVPDLGGWSWVVAGCFAVLLYASVLVHELGHALTARAFGLPVLQINLHMLGGDTQIGSADYTPGRQFVIAGVGPVLSIVLGAAGLGLAQLLTAGTVLHLLAVQLGAANLLVGLFNLLPGLPLDGGQLVRAVVWGVSGNPHRATVVAAWAGRAVAVTIVLVPVVWSRAHDRDPDLVFLAWSVLIAAFIWMGAGQSLRMQRLNQRLGRLSVRELTRRAIPVFADVPLAEALRRLGEVGARALVVVDRDDQPLALVSEAAVTATPVDRRPWVSVSTVSRRLEPGLVLRMDLDGPGLVDAMRTTPAAEYLVVDDQQRVYGVLATSDVNRAFAGA